MGTHKALGDDTPPKCGGMAEETLCVNMVCIELRSQDTCSPWDQCKKVFNKFWNVSKVSAHSDPNNGFFWQNHCLCPKVIANMGWIVSYLSKPWHHSLKFTQVFGHCNFRSFISIVQIYTIRCPTLVSIHGYLRITWPFCNIES